MHLSRVVPTVSGIERWIVVCRNGPAGTSYTCGAGSSPAIIASVNFFSSPAAFGTEASSWFDIRKLPVDEGVRMNGLYNVAYGESGLLFVSRKSKKFRTARTKPAFPIVFQS